MTTTTTTLQLKLRGIFLAGDLPEKLTNPVGDIFSNIVSAVGNFFQYLITLFNKEFPPEKRDEQIHWLFHGATPYLIGAAVLITILCCGSCLLSCISCIFVGIFKVVYSFFRWIFVGIYTVVCSFFRCIRWCLCCGTRSGIKMMKAPGRPSMRIPRAKFEGNPSGYFRNLRGQPNNFVY